MLFYIIKAIMSNIFRTNSRRFAKIKEANAKKQDQFWHFDYAVKQKTQILFQETKLAPKTNDPVKRSLFKLVSNDVFNSFSTNKMAEEWTSYQKHAFCVFPISPEISAHHIGSNMQKIFGKDLSGFEILPYDENLRSLKPDSDNPLRGTILTNLTVNKRIIRKSKNSSKQDYQKKVKDTLRILQFYLKGLSLWPNIQNHYSSKHRKKPWIGNFWTDRPKFMRFVIERLETDLKESIISSWHSQQRIKLLALHKRFDTIVCSKSQLPEAKKKGYGKMRFLSNKTPFGYSNWSDFSFFAYSKEMPMTKPIVLPKIGKVFVLDRPDQSRFKIKVYYDKNGRCFLEYQSKSMIKKLNEKRKLKIWKLTDSFYSFYKRGIDIPGTKMDKSYLLRKYAIVYLNKKIEPFRLINLQCLGTNLGKALAKFNEINYKLNVTISQNRKQKMIEEKFLKKFENMESTQIQQNVKQIKFANLGDTINSYFQLRNLGCQTEFMYKKIHKENEKIKYVLGKEQGISEPKLKDSEIEKLFKIQKELKEHYKIFKEHPIFEDEECSYDDPPSF
ncbi:hypothetical protein MHBO_000527 [Bonamia ostreae]|uniref:Uncharacterized protein n=1 Tax=Bonamia ostreae TaxID=126728 RepID=A0ABV2AFV7_9EUKA